MPFDWSEELLTSNFIFYSGIFKVYIKNAEEHLSESALNCWSILLGIIKAIVKLNLYFKLACQPIEISLIWVSYSIRNGKLLYNPAW